MTAGGRLIPAQLPGPRGRCRACGQLITWARTVRNPETGTGGRAMPLDLVPSTAGNVAVRESAGHQLRARVLSKGETHDRYAEVLAMPHAATCQPRLPEPSPVDELAARRARKARP